MSITNCRSAEPLYIVALHNHPKAETLFKNWAREQRLDHVHVQGHRMMLHDQPSFERFRITWNHGFGMITVWDSWMRRHIYLD